MVKKILLVFIAIVLFFAISEILLGYGLWITRSGMQPAIYYTAHKIYHRLNPFARVSVSYLPNSMYVPDKYLGYSALPGSYTVKLTDTMNGRYYTFKTMINGEGNRITSNFPELFEGKSEIWIFGDSCTYGWGNNDETTFPFFLQQFLPHYRVVNYADNGYANVHAYLQIKRKFETKNVSPSIIVIVYGDYFNERNCAAPSRLKGYVYNKAEWNNVEPSKFFYPKAVVDSEQLKIEYVPLFQKFNGKDPSKSYQYKVTKKILSEIYKMGTRNNSKMILAYIHGKDSDEAVSFAAQIGYVISDIRPKAGMCEVDNFEPFDPHPGPLAQNKFAIKLYKSISELTSTVKK